MKKFILGKGGNSIVNAEYVQAVYICEDEDMDKRGDAGENLRAAQKYLAELVDELNGGAQ